MVLGSCSHLTLTVAGNYKRAPGAVVPSKGLDPTDKGLSVFNFHLKPACKKNRFPLLNIVENINNILIEKPNL